MKIKITSIFFFPFPEFLSIQTAGNFTNEPKTDHNKSLKKKEKESSPDRESGAVRPEKGEQWAEERKREQEAYRKCPFRLCCRQGERPHLRWFASLWLQSSSFEKAFGDRCFCCCCCPASSPWKTLLHLIERTPNPEFSVILRENQCRSSQFLGLRCSIWWMELLRIGGRV